MQKGSLDNESCTFIPLSAIQIWQQWPGMELGKALLLSVLQHPQQKAAKSITQSWWSKNSSSLHQQEETHPSELCLTSLAPAELGAEWIYLSPEPGQELDVLSIAVPSCRQNRTSSLTDWPLPPRAVCCCFTLQCFPYVKVSCWFL